MSISYGNDTSSNEIVLETKDERGKLKKMRESCWNCNHRIGSALCKEDVDPYSKSNWCSHYEPDNKLLICNRCGKCSTPKMAGDCPIIVERKKREEKLLREARQNNIRWE